MRTSAKDSNVTTTRTEKLELRPFTPADQPAVIALIDSIYSEYGDRICLENSDVDLLDIGANYATGRFMVLAAAGTLYGTVAVKPNAEHRGGCYLKRLYLRAELRGGPWADLMLDWAIDATRELGMTRIEGWSDTRFTRAHSFYAKHGFAQGGTRTMNDGWEPYQEFHFSRDI